MSGERLKEANQRLLDGEVAAAEEIFRDMLKPALVTAISCFEGLARCARKRGAREESLAMFERVAMLAPLEPGRRVAAQGEAQKRDGSLAAAETASSSKFSIFDRNDDPQFQ